MRPVEGSVTIVSERGSWSSTVTLAPATEQRRSHRDEKEGRIGSSFEAFQGRDREPRLRAPGER